jgi:putative transposase
VFAWTLLDNHFHLYLRTPQANLSAGMHDLNSGYVSFFNRRHRRCGALFQGRFKAILVEDESHATELTRYLHLNGVRARNVGRPEDYAWSSYQEYLGMRKAPAWLDWETVLSEVAQERSRARAAYRRFVEAGLSQPLASPPAAAVGGMFLGGSAWVDGWRRRLADEPLEKAVPLQRRLAWRPGVEEVIDAAAQAFGVEGAEVLVSRRHGNDARLAAIYLVRQVTDEGVGAMGRRFGGVSAAAISKTVARVGKRRGEDRPWDRRLAKILDQLHANPGSQKTLNVKP